MPVGTGNISLQDVVNEIAGAQSSLRDCFNDANSGGFNPTYNKGGGDFLSEFRGYSDITTYYRLTGCAGAPTRWTTLVPPLANQRFILPSGPFDTYYVWDNTSTTTPQTVTGSLQIVSGQTFCP